MKKWIADMEREIKYQLAILPDQSPYINKRTPELFEECLSDTRYMLMANALQLISCVEHKRYPMAHAKFKEKIDEWRKEFFSYDQADVLEEFCIEIIWRAIVSLANKTAYVDLQKFDFE